MTTTQKAKPMGPKTLTGSRDAKRLAAVLLEVLSGVRGPQDGAEALKISLSRYYLLETRALQGFITALEPLPKGRQKSAADELKALHRDKRRLEQELLRSQALVRAAQRSLGLSATSSSVRKRKSKLVGKDGKPVRRCRRVKRAANVVKVLRRAEVVDLPSDPTTSGAVAGSDL